MHFGLNMECDYIQGKTEQDAFNDVFAQVDLADAVGLDGVWIAERHFSSSEAGQPSIASSPIVLSTAIAARTQRLRVGTGVYVLPLNHPVRIAEEVATLDYVSQGRFDLGVGRSGFTTAYEGYGYDYGESRERLQECLDVLVKAWTQERFSHQGKYYQFEDVCVTPKPLQQPHPPIYMAATTSESFPIAGRKRRNLVVGVRRTSVGQVKDSVRVYRETWREAGHPGHGDVTLRLPVYVAETQAEAHLVPEASALKYYRRLSESLTRSVGRAGTAADEDRARLARELANITYDDLLRDWVIFGTPEEVTERLQQLIEEIDLSGVILEMNAGGLVPIEHILASLKLFGERVAPQLR
ncbi:LLM class flavin-dependent oxidoreductase [Candidatus Entotheonella palauensis]|uniref:LLM class flavin-dependent oxidoreductase n=1 Tax=Candidatus Entotheonella palauensis TaxID=93172 RepID=UPI000B7D2F59|nr:LLM class flavin-dependent oxidoreductase [Candidatus Entotheonella palauensis]